jgi:translocation and assembly module TamA
LAFRARLGSTVGSSLDALPANKRFFAGGGNSVRGFGFQNAGPLDAMGDPIGGRSVLEGAVELRAKAVKKFETAIFFDAATVSAASFPDLGAPFFTGAGAGLRYLSKAGPVRLDVAFPFRRREEDRAFQIYISLGQSF